MKAQNSLSAQLEKINLSHENILKLSKAYLEAIISNKSNVSVDVEDNNGNQQTIVIPSNIFISNELQRLLLSFRNLVGLSEDGKGRLIADDGSFREIFLSSFLTAFRPNRNELEVSTDINVETNSIIENLVSPLTSLEISLDKKMNGISSSFITKIVADNFDGVEDGMSFGQTKLILTQNKTKFEIVEFEQPITSKKSRYYGMFLISSYNIDENGIYRIQTNTVRYSDDNNLYENTRLLEIGDKLTNNNGNLLFEVTNINEESNSIFVKIIGGVGSIDVNESLYLRDSIDDKISIKVPVRLNEKSMIFISVVDKSTNVGSSKSAGILFNSDDFTITQNGISSTFNEYFSSKVADVGRYIESVVRENTIPAILGETPLKPSVRSNDFNVVQINKHLTNTPELEKLKKLEKEKTRTLNNISILSTSITELNEKIASGNYNSQAKLDADKTQVNSLIDEKIKMSKLLSTLVADINSQITNNAERSISPKYRVRGFWDVQKPIASNITDPQHVVQYDIRYRYVSNSGNTANSEQMVYQSGDNQVNAVFSAWTWLKTQALERYVDSDGISRWKDNVPSDTENYSINQLDLPINYGESVEFQIRAISEAGYPNTPLTSDWSDLVRVEFPSELLQESDISAMLRKNDADALKVSVMEEFSNQGITKHIAKSFQEQERYFPHSLDEIASGKVTDEQKQITASEYMRSLEKQIELLKEKVDRRYASVTVQIMDENLVEHDVNNFSTINLFAGNYSDEVDLTNETNYGSIVEKTFYLKLINRNQQTVEMLSISSGVLNQDVPNTKYNNISIFLTGTNTVQNQKKGQIFYLRNININGDENLYVENSDIMSTTVSNSDISPNALDSQKNIVNFNGSIAELVALTTNADISNYVTITRNHPSFIEFQQTGDPNILSQTLNRLKYFNSTFKADTVQNKFSSNTIIKYSEEDKYTIGKNTCGATMFISPNDLTSFQVDGIDTSSSKEIYSGSNDSIMLPIKFQFRMTDAQGKPNGDTSLTLSTNFEYKKKIGFDLLINNKLFSFDVNVSARFRATSVTNNVIGSTNTNQQLTQPNIQ